MGRPATVRPCPACGEALGANYDHCPACYAAIESIWQADWQALLAQEGVAAREPEEVLLAQVVIDEFGRHPWTVVDTAMSLLHCPECGGELGENDYHCGQCGMAFGSSILSEFGATGNEHALHIGRWVLRYPQRHPPNAVAAWRLSMPRLLTGWLPSIKDAQRIMTLIKADRMDEVNELVRQLDKMINRHED